MKEVKKIGRPSTDNPKNKNVTVRFTEEEVDLFDDFCKKNKTTKSNLIREYVLDLIKK